MPHEFVVGVVYFCDVLVYIVLSRLSGIFGDEHDILLSEGTVTIILVSSNSVGAGNTQQFAYILNFDIFIYKQYALILTEPC